MTLQSLSTPFRAFEDTRPAAYAPRPWAAAAAQAPLPSHAWLKELPQVDAPESRRERRASRSLRVAGLAAAALLALFALGLAASLLDAQGAPGTVDRSDRAGVTTGARG